ncbi:MAG: hypothetical protein BroJett012_08800 [Betaproteobacteria bacterium]|nr:MAG: hypothetical protein BroJett012_08800 [Betaproteobacteria bacterium]
MDIIGITGLAGSGKDTFAEAIMQEGWRRYSFTDPIKDGLAAMFGFPRVWLDDNEAKESVVHPYGVSLQHMMQTLGTEWGMRLIHSDVWILRAKQFIAEASLVYPGVVIPDVTSPDQAKFIRDNGGLLVHLVRDGATLVEGVGQPGHDKALWFEPSDLVVYNDDSIDRLKAKAKGLALGFHAFVP